jgi:hypothetical protein
MMQYIAGAAKTIRCEHQLSHAHVACARAVRESTVVRFESGKMRCVDLDGMIAAYAEVTGVATIEFWDRALAAWHADETPTTTTTRSTTNGDGNTRDQRRRVKQRA